MSYKYRIHDPRIGRFLSIDPLAPDYPHNSPYAFSENKVVAHVELEGLESMRAPGLTNGDYDPKLINKAAEEVAENVNKSITSPNGASLLNK